MISVSIAGVILLLITIVICITVYKLYKIIYKERHLPAVNTVELSQNECYGQLSQNECYGPGTAGNVAYNATINRYENPPSPVIYEDINLEKDYEQTKM